MIPEFIVLFCVLLTQFTFKLNKVYGYFFVFTTWKLQNELGIFEKNMISNALLENHIL